MFKTNLLSLNRATERMKKGELKLEEILDDEDLILDVKSNPNSQFATFFSNEVVRQLIDYVTKMPEEDDQRTGHKFPFNACEILCSDNSFILDRLLEATQIENDEDNDDDDSGSSEEGKNRADQSEEEQGGEVTEEKKKKSDSDSEDENEKEKEEEIKDSNEGSQDNENKEENKEIVNPGESINETNENNTDNENNDEEIPIEISNNKKSHHKKNHAATEVNFKDETEEQQQEDLFNLSQEEEEAKSMSVDNNKHNYKVVFSLLDYFYDFLLVNRGSALNFVLAGYFSKIFNHLVLCKGDVIVKYIFQYKLDLLDSFIQNVSRQSISDSLTRILLVESSDPSFPEIKLKILDMILISISSVEEDDIDKAERIENISQLLLECFSNSKFFALFMHNVESLQKLHKIVIDHLDNQFVVKDLIKILIKINENILRDFGVTVNSIFTQDCGNYLVSMEEDLSNTVNNLNAEGNGACQSTAIMTRISENPAMLNHLENIIQILTETTQRIVKDFINSESNCEIQTTFDVSKKTLGVKKLLEFEYIKTLIEILIQGNSVKIFVDHIKQNFKFLITSGFFNVALQNFYQYEFNNLYQKLFEQLMILLCNKSTPGYMIHHIFLDTEVDNQDGSDNVRSDIAVVNFGDDSDFLSQTNCNLLNSIIDNCINDAEIKFQFSSGKTINAGYLAVLCNMCSHITSSDNPHLLNIISENSQFKIFCSTLVEPIVNRFNTGLLYEINKKTKVTNLDQLNEFECPAEEKPKLDFKEDFSPDGGNNHNPNANAPLKQIIRVGLINYANGGLQEEFEERQIENNMMNELNDLNNDEGGNCFEYKQRDNNNAQEEDRSIPHQKVEYEVLDEGFAFEKPDEDAQMLFQVRNSAYEELKNYRDDDFNVDDLSERVIGLNLEDSNQNYDHKSNQKSKEEFYDNAYWKSPLLFDEESILNDLSLD